MTESPRQSDVDPVVVVLEWLRAHPAVTDLLGGPEHVSGIYEDPWPHLVVDDGNTQDLRDLRYEAEWEVELQLYGAPNGAPGKAALRRTAVRLMEVVCDLPEQQATSPYLPVVSRVRATALVYQPLSSGQPVYNMSLAITVRPPSEYAPPD